MCAYNVYPNKNLAERIQKFTRGVQYVLETLLLVPGSNQLESNLNLVYIYVMKGQLWFHFYKADYEKNNTLFLFYKQLDSMVSPKSCLFFLIF